MAHSGKNSVNVDLNFQIQNLREINTQVNSFLSKLTDGSRSKIDITKSFGNVQNALANLEKMSKKAFSNDFDFERTQEAIQTIRKLYTQLFSELSKSTPDIALIDDDVFASAKQKIEELSTSIIEARRKALLTLKSDKDIISLNLDESAFEGDFDSLVELARKKGAEAGKAYDDAFTAEQRAEKDLETFKSRKGGYDDQVELSKRIGVFKKGLTSSRSAFYGKSSELFGQAREGKFTGNVGAFREELQKSLEGTYKSLNAGDLKEAIKLAITNDKFKGAQSGEYSVEDLAKDLLEILNTSSAYTISQKTIDDLHDKTIALSEAKKATKEKERARDKTQRVITNLEGRRAELVDAPAAGANAQIEEQNRLILEHAAAQREAAYEAENFGNKQSEMSSDLNDANNKLEESRKQLKEISGLSSATQTITSFINRYIGLAAIIRTTVSMFRSAISTIKEIDKTITDIAVVTNMSQDTLWGRIGEYTNLANQYGVAVNDVYTVSKIFYQQGLQTADVMSMTTETLKMAKIAGMSYTEAADAMTVATRAFNIEIGKSSIVSDVYSKLAASMAVDSQEIAYAMEKTASSAANVGMSLETTSAFISTMVQATREGAQNIGSALKSIISRFGEMKADPTALVDSEGEAMSFNKVDDALQSVGISIKDANNQFRNFDDVIMELAAKWNTLDKNSQRYVATIMAGNRQQSRFIALVSDYEELSRAVNLATTAEGASAAQVIKTLDSIETKAQQVKNAWQQMYLSIGGESVIKNILSGATKALTNLGKQGFKSVIASVMQVLSLGKTLITTFRLIELNAKAKVDKTELDDTKTEINSIDGKDINVKVKVDKTELDAVKGELNPGSTTTNGTKESSEANKDGKVVAAIEKGNKDAKKMDSKTSNTLRGIGLALNTIGTSVSLLGALLKDNPNKSYESTKLTSGFGQLASGAGTGLTTAATLGMLNAGPWGMAIGAIASALPILIPAISNIIDGAFQNASEKIAILEEQQASQHETTVKTEATASDLNSQISNLKVLQEKMYSSDEALKEYQEAMQNLTASYPELISSVDEAGRAIADLDNAEKVLIQTRQKAAQAAIEEARTGIEKEIVKTEAAKEYFPASNFAYGYDFFWDESARQEVVDDLTNYLNTSLDADKSVEDLIKKIKADTSITFEDVGILTKVYGKSSRAATITDFGLEEFNSKTQYREKEATEAAREWLERNYGVLGFNDKKQAYKTYGISNKKDTLSYEKYIILKEAIDSVKKSSDGLVDSYYNQIESQNAIIALGKHTSGTGAQTSLISRVQGNGAYASLIGSALTLGAKNAGYGDFSSWEAGDLGAADNFSKKIVNTLYSNLAAMSDEAISQFESDISNFSNITDISVLTEKYSFLTDTLAEGLAKKYSEYLDNLTSRFNNQLSEFGANEGYEELSNIIQTYFDADSENNIIPKYISYISSTIASINQDIKNGLPSQAKAKSNTLGNVLSFLSGLEDNVQDDLFTYITGIDFSDYASIQNAIEQISEYGEKHSIDVTQIINSLTAALGSISFNLTTLSNSIVAEVAQLADDIDNLFSSFSKGLSLSDAIGTLEKLKVNNKDLTFKELFDYDTALGAWVYTQDGYDKALKSQTKQIDSQIEGLEAAKSALDKDYNNFNDGNYEAISELAVSAFKSYYLQQTGNALEGLANAEQDVWKAWYDSQIDNYNAATIAYENLKQNLQYGSLVNSIDFSRLITTGGTTADKNAVEALKKELDKADENSNENLVEYLYNNSKITLEKYKEITDNISSSYSSAIGDLVSGKLTANAQKILAKANIGVDENAANYVDQAQQLYNAVKDSFNQSDKLSSFATVFKSNFSETTGITGLIGKGVKFSIEDFEEGLGALLGNAFNPENYFNLNGTVNENYSDYFKVDDLGNIIVEDIAKYDEFLKEIVTQTGINWDSFTNTEAYVNAHRSLVKASTEKAEEDAAKVTNYVKDIISADFGSKVDTTGIFNEAGEVKEKTVEWYVNFLHSLGSEENLASPDNRKTAVEAIEALNNFFTDTMGKVFKDAIEGTLDTDDYELLIDNFGLSAEQFNQTANGWKLTAGVLSQVYDKLAALDPTRAFNILSNTESLYANESLGGLLDEIFKLEEKINNTTGDENTEYKKQLRLVKDIYKYRSLNDINSTNGNANKLTISEEIVVNTWEDLSKRLNILSETKTGDNKGFLGLEDWKNITRSLTDESAEQIAKDLGLDNIKTAIQLYNKGLNALSTVEHTGMVDLTRVFGEDWESAVGSLSEGTTNFTKELAESQIQILNDEIKMLDAVIALQEMDGLSIENLGNTLFSDESLNNITEQGETFFEQIIKIFGEGYDDIKDTIIPSLGDNITLDMLLHPEQLPDSIDFSAYVNALTGVFGGLFDIENWDIDTVPTLIGSILARAGLSPEDLAEASRTFYTKQSVGGGAPGGGPGGAEDEPVSVNLNTVQAAINDVETKLGDINGTVELGSDTRGAFVSEREAVAGAAQEVKEAETAIQEVNTSVRGAVDAFGESGKKIDDTAKKIDDTSEELGKVKGSIEETGKNFEAAAADLENTGKKLNDATEAVKNSETAIQETEQSIQAAANALDNSGEIIDATAEKISDASEEIGQTEDAIRETSEDIEAATVGLGETGEKLNNATEEVKKSEIAIQETEQSIQDTADALNESGKKIDSTGERISQAEDAIGEAGEDIDAAGQSVGKAEQTLGNGLRQLDDTTGQFEGAATDLSAAINDSLTDVTTNTDELIKNTSAVDLLTTAINEGLPGVTITGNGGTNNPATAESFKTGYQAVLKAYSEFATQNTGKAAKWFNSLKGQLKFDTGTNSWSYNEEAVSTEQLDTVVKKHIQHFLATPVAFYGEDAPASASKAQPSQSSYKPNKFIPVAFDEGSTSTQPAQAAEDLQDTIETTVEEAFTSPTISEALTDLFRYGVFADAGEDNYDAYANALAAFGIDLNDADEALKDLAAYGESIYDAFDPSEWKRLIEPNFLVPTLASTGATFVGKNEQGEDQAVALDVLYNFVDNLKSESFELFASKDEQAAAEAYLKGEASLEDTIAAFSDSEIEAVRNNAEILETQLTGLNSSSLSSISTLGSIYGRVGSIPSDVFAFDWKTKLDGISIHGDLFAGGWNIVGAGDAGASDAKGRTGGNSTSGYVHTQITPSMAGKVSFAPKSRAKGNALASGNAKTLMGELGPELVVSNDRWFLAGEHGAEFVNLDSDAIVFNHKQTKGLLSQGHIGSIGKPKVSENKSIARAKGNAFAKGGPAMASAKEVRDQLIGIRNMWQSLLEQGSKQIAATGGGGGGSAETKAILNDFEQWYNLLRQIEKIEQQITYQEQLRENMRKGGEYIKSLEYELALHEKEAANYKQLSELQHSYYEARRRDQANSIYGAFFTYDSDGLMQYIDESFHVLKELNKTDDNGVAVRTVDQQYAMIVDFLTTKGYSQSLIDATLNYAEDTTEAKTNEDRVQNFWDKFDGWIDEMDSIYDSYNDYLGSIEEEIQKQNDILKEYNDIQLGVEKMLLTAIEDREQSRIDDLEEQYDVLSDAAQAYTDGLTTALNKEKELYDTNADALELAQLQRKLSILQRSGAGAAEIKALQDQINSRMQDSYFEQRQNEIDAIKEASDAQLEKLQTQINILSETLEYQKENGLLWGEVYEMMNNWDPNKMADFVHMWTKEYQSLSALDVQEQMRDAVMEIEKWVEYSNSNGKFNDFYDAISKDTLSGYGVNVNNDTALQQARAAAKVAYTDVLKDGGTYSQAEAAAIEAIKTQFTRTRVEGADYNPSLYSGTTSSSNGGGNVTMKDIQAQYSNLESKLKSAQNKVGSMTKMSLEQFYATGFTKYPGVSLSVLQNKAATNVDSAVSKSAQNLLYSLNSQYKDYSQGFDKTVAQYKAEISAIETEMKRLKAGYPEALKGYSEGGIDDYTGLAMLHGTKSKPEGILNAADYASFKSLVSTSGQYSIQAAIEAIHELANKFSKTFDSDTINNGVIIQKAEVNLNVDHIDNDYDAAEAAQAVMDNIVAIARKNNTIF